jgi:hypothetical protein
MSGMGRRDFVALLGGAAACAWPLRTSAALPVVSPAKGFKSIGDLVAAMLAEIYLLKLE